MNNKRVFILGAFDPERAAIESYLKRNGEVFYYAAAFNGRAQAITQVFPGNTYQATDIHDAVGNKIVIADHVKVYLHETAIKGIQGETLDHHNGGDAGYGRPIEEAVEASSFGQVADVVGVELSEEEKIIAAMDHNLQATLSGKVPGIDAVKALKLRAAFLAGRFRITEEEAIESIFAAAKLIEESAENLIFDQGAKGVIDLRHAGPNGFLADAACYMGKTVLHHQDTRDPGKVMLSSGDEDLLKQLEEAGYLQSEYPEYTQFYGDPARGFLGCEA